MSCIKEEMLTKACQYAINAMIFMATLTERKEKAGIKEIAIAINSPLAFTAKILQSLVRSELLSSAKGPNGGFFLRVDPSEVFLAEIVHSIDGDLIFKGCALGLKSCSETHPCPVHHKYKAVREHLTGMLRTTSLKDVAEGVNTGISFLRY